MGRRRNSRELALQFLYGHDFQGKTNDPDKIVEEWRVFADCFEADTQILPYAELLIQGICQHVTAIDEALRRHSHHWRLERMSVVDRNILRLAAYEMQYMDDVPRQVAINEALEIAKRYSAPDAVPFINGILDAFNQGV